MIIEDVYVYSVWINSYIEMMTLIFLHNNQMSIKYLLQKPHLKKKEFKLTEETNKKKDNLILLTWNQQWNYIVFF